MKVSRFPSSVLRSCAWRGLLAVVLSVGTIPAAQPLPLSTDYWKDPAFLKAFNGSYRIEARIEPALTTAQRGVLVQVQELMAAGKRKEAIELLRGSELTAESAALTFNLANLLLEEGEGEKAIEAYGKALEAYPSFRRAHRNLGLAHVRLEQWDEAREHLKEALRLGDSEGLTYGLLGYCHLADGQHASALQAYRLARLTEPEVAEWSAGIAQCLQQLGQREEAVSLLQEVIGKRPMEPSYAVLLANIHLELEQADRAVKVLELPHRLGLLAADSTLLLAELHLRGGRLAQAREVMDSAFAEEARPPSGGALLRLLQVSVARQQWDLAKALWERVAPDARSDRAMRLTRSRYLIESGQDVEAGAELLEGLTREDPTDGEALLALAEQRLAGGQPAAAELIYERAAADGDWAFRAYTGLTRLHASQARYAAALEALDKALAIQADDELQRYRKALVQVLEASR